MFTKKKRHINMKLQLPSSPEKGRRRGMDQLGMINSKNARRKKLHIRRLSAKKKETEMSLSLSATPSSSSDHSFENYDVSERKTCSNHVTCLSHGMASVIGRRKDMEDSVRVKLGLMGDHNTDRKYDFFGVYDGHGGARVAEACKERLHEVLVEVIAEEYKKGGGGVIEWDKVMEGCFGKMDEEVNSVRVREGEEMVGSTAVVAVVGKEVVVVANCGDSRAVLSRGGLVVPLSTDHKPDRPDELTRVEAAGGRVINWNGPRILGVLATSRSIGDQHLKPFVISKPEVMVTERTDRDEFLILASDGLWDVVSNEVACQVVRKCFSGRIKWATSLDAGNQDRATRAAAVLAELAMSRGSSDNISVIVVELNKPTKFRIATAL